MTKSKHDNFFRILDNLVAKAPIDSYEPTILSRLAKPELKKNSAQIADDYCNAIAEKAGAAIQDHQSGSKKIESWMPEFDDNRDGRVYFPLLSHSEKVEPNETRSLRLCLVEPGKVLAIVFSVTKPDDGGVEKSFLTAQFDGSALLQASRRMYGFIEQLGEKAKENLNYYEASAGPTEPKSDFNDDSEAQENKPIWSQMRA